MNVLQKVRLEKGYSKYRLAKEIFEGNFENLPLEELKNPRVTTNYFNSVSDFVKEYSKPEYLSSKDFEGVTYLKIIHTQGSEYHGKKSSKYHVMTDVLHVWNHHGSGTLQSLEKTQATMTKTLKFKWTM